MGLLHSTNFATQADAGPVTAGSALVDGWIDVVGDVYQQVAGQMTLPNPTSSVLMRPHSEDSTTGTEHVEITGIVAGGASPFAVVRINETTKTGIAAYCLFGSVLYIGELGTAQPPWVSSNNVNTGLSGSISAGDSVTITLVASVSTTVANTTNVTASCFNNTTNTALVTAFTFTTANTTIFSSRGVGLGCYGSSLPINYTSAASYDESGLPLAPGNAVFSSATTTTVSLATANISEGSTPYTYQWQVSLDGLTSWANISGATSSTVTYTPGDANARWFRAMVTDAASTTIPSKPCLAFVNQPAVKFLGIGDSRMFITPDGTHGSLDYMVSALKPLLEPRSVSAINESLYGTTTTTWLPSDPSNLLVNAVSSAVTAGCTDAWIDLGVNDSDAPLSASDYAAHVKTITAYIKAQGIANVWWSYSYYFDFTPQCDNPILGYQAQLDQLAAQGIIKIGAKIVYKQVAANASAWLNVDGLHPNATGVQAIGAIWASAYATATTAPASGGAWGGRGIGIGI